MRRRLLSVGRIVMSLAAVAVVTAGYARLVPANPTTIALSYVVVILLIATGWGIGESTAASVAAMLCFNFFFLPPVGTLTIADPQNWVALVAFLLTAIIASQLSGRARQRNIEAVARQRDLERLYALSRALLLSDGGGSVPGRLHGTSRTPSSCRPFGLYDQRTDTVSWAGSAEWPAIDGKLREVARRATSIRDPAGLCRDCDSARRGADWQPGDHGCRESAIRCCTRSRIWLPSGSSGRAHRKPRRAPRPHSRVASCARPCWMRWPTSSRRLSHR